MILKIGDNVLVKHYSNDYSIGGTIHELNNKFILLKLSESSSIMNFMEGDPVVILYTTNTGVYTISSDVHIMDLKDNLLHLTIDNINVYTYQRINPRIAVSLLANLTVKNLDSPITGIIKDISYSGLLIYLKEDLPINTDVTINVFVNESVISFQGTIVNKDQREYYYEYGLSFTYSDIESGNGIVNKVLDIIDASTRN